MKEYDLMMQCVDYCIKNDIYVHHINNEEGTATRRALGMRKGVPDLILMGKRVSFVELKRNEYLKPSEAQQFMISRLRKRGIFASCCGSISQFEMTANQTALAKPIGIGKYKNVKMPGTQPIKRVSGWYRTQIYRDPYDVFGLKLFSDENKDFPWMIDIEKKRFIATSKSKITDRAIYIGWDVLIV